MNSLMSSRIIASADPKKLEDSFLHSSVLPTPVGPQNMKAAMGRPGFRRPALARRRARDTLLTASCCPITLCPSLDSSCSSRADSVADTCSTAMPVQPDTTWATSASVTQTSSALAPSTSRSLALSSEASSKRSAATASSTRALSSRSFSCWSPVPAGEFFSIFPTRLLSRVFSSSWRSFSAWASVNSSLATARLFFSLRLWSSRSSFRRSAMSSAISSSWKSCWRTLAPASSITSMALSGRNRSLMYCEARRTEARMASGSYLSWWWRS
mmetsp:Transcript_88979/g.212395  ORF Transcript_88979/g.212395 Transcript_88979/m.212395 type:complete len:270 (-) Transcript_88979:1503-2312(-)